MATSVATNGKVTRARVERFAVHRDKTTTGDVMAYFHVSRNTARARLMELADSGVLRHEGKGRGAAFRPTYMDSNGAEAKSGGGSNGKAKPRARSRKAPAPRPRRTPEPELITRLRSDCDTELARIDARLEEIAAEQAALSQEQAALKNERTPVAAARKVLLAQ